MRQGTIGDPGLELGVAWIYPLSSCDGSDLTVLAKGHNTENMLLIFFVCVCSSQQAFERLALQ